MADWDKIKTEYVTTDISMRKLAEKYGVKENSLLSKAKREKWADEKKRFAHKVDTKVTQKMVTAVSNEKFDRYKVFTEIVNSTLLKAQQAVEDLDKRTVGGEVVGGLPIQPKDIKSLTSAIADLATLLGYTSTMDEEENTTGVILIPPVAGDKHE